VGTGLEEAPIMASRITLKKGRLSAALLRTVRAYYKAIDLGSAYTEMKWRQWKDNCNIVRYAVMKGGRPVGRLLYNPQESTIEDLILTDEWVGKGLESLIIDELIKRESLVAAKILKADAKKYGWMVGYGFRPTRSFTENGFAMLKMDLSTSVLLRKLDGVKPPVAYRKKERVAVEKVADTQTYEQIKQGVSHLIDKLGGLGKFVKQGQTVVIKPNVVSDHALKDGRYTGGIVTDIRIIKALVEILLPIAAEVIIAEGSSINRSETAKMFTHYGYDRLVELDPTKISLLDLNSDEQVEKAVPGGKRMLSRKVPRTLEKADVIINVPVLKIHFAATASLSIKSLQGAVPPLEKYMTHFFGLWQNLVNINHLVKPTLIIIDGLVGQEDFGPVSGTPKKMDLLIGGTNPVAVDAVAMRVMGLDPLTSPPVWMAYMQGLGPVEPGNILVIGPPVETVARPFRQPEIDVGGGRDIAVHAGGACGGCAGYLHFVLSKLRRPDPHDKDRLLIDRPREKRAAIYLGPETTVKINPEETNIFMGICQQHHAEFGNHLPGCPPHAEVIVNGIFSLFPDVEKPKYADESEEKKLGEMLQKILSTMA
jgi:uncharacterized protein (DUF362 family)